MREIIRTNQFKKDVKRMQKRDADMSRLRTAIQELASSGTLSQRYRPHKLSGEWDNMWECHLKGDWLIVYNVTETELWLARTGTHADLFG